MKYSVDWSAQRPRFNLSKKNNDFLLDIKVKEKSRLSKISIKFKTVRLKKVCCFETWSDKIFFVMYSRVSIDLNGNPTQY
jgi:hypothetical protein